jgi:hypothetical protein
MLSRLEEKLAELDANENLTRNEAAEYITIARAVMFGEQVVESVHRTLRDLRTSATYNSRSTYEVAANTVLYAMELVAAAHYPAKWSPRELAFGYSQTCSSSVLKVAADPNVNFYRPYLQNCLVDIQTWKPHLIGISVNYLCQLVPGITLASMIRNNHSGATIVMGGTLISAYRDRWDAFRPFFDIVDAFIPFEGELPLLRLIDNIRDERRISNVPGVVHLRDNQVFYNDPGEEDTPGDRTLPDFSDFPLDDYLSGQRILPYRTSYGCYWGKCKFCAHHLAFRNGYRKKSIDHVIRDLCALSQQYQASIFYFVDDALPLGTVKHLSEKVQAGELQMTWFGEMRFENGLDRPVVDTLAKGGCRLLLFGLESGVQRILSMMEKGTEPRTAARILEACDDAGINTQVMFFLGFPGESAVEVIRTIEFVEANARFITHVGFSGFALLYGSEVHANCSAHGVTIVEGDTTENLALKSKYQVAVGISESEAELAVAQAKERSIIRQLIELPLVSRNHLAFLPTRSTHSMERQLQDKQTFQCLRPRLRSGLTSIQLNFDLGNIRESIQSDPPLPSEKKDVFAVRAPSTYLIDPERKDVVEIGEHGVLIASLCDGKRSVGEILELVGESNRAVVTRYLEKLLLRGILVEGDQEEDTPK